MTVFLASIRLAHASVAVDELMEHSHSVPIYEDWQAITVRMAEHLRYALEAFRTPMRMDWRTSK